MSEEIGIVLDTVSIKPIIKASWLPEGHDGEIRYTNCYEQLMPVKDGLSGAFKTGLSEKEAKSIELKMKLKEGTLSPYNEEFWGDHKNGAKLTRDGLVLNPNYPADRIKLAWLSQHPFVAGSESEKYDDPAYGYVITSVVQEATVKNKKRELLKVAYQKLWTLSTEEKSDVLRLYGKKVDRTTSPEVIDDTINTMVENEPKAFLEIVEDPDFKTKILIKESIQCKAIILEGSKYKLNGGDIIGHDINEAVEYINDPQNATTKKSLVAKVKLAKTQ